MLFEFAVRDRPQRSFSDMGLDMLDQIMTSVTEFFEWLMADGTIWAIWTTAAVLLFVGLRFLRAIVAGLFKNDSRPANSFRNIVGHLISATNSLFLLVLSFVVTIPFVGIELSERWHSILMSSFMVLFVLQGAFWGRVVVKALLEGMMEKHSSDTGTLRNAQSLIGLFANFAIFAIALITILQNLGQDVGALIAGLGVGGIAIALAAQNLFKDLFASLSIILDKPFVKGDFIVWNGLMGNVERIGLKTTRVRALSGEQLVVSNDSLLSNEIQNFKRMAERRVVLSLGVTYQTSRETLEALPGRLRDLIDPRDLCRFDRAHMATYGDSAIVFELVFYVQSPEYNIFMDEKQEILLGIHRLFEELNADFAYPTRTLWVEGMGGAGKAE
ncbi:mechanosensitive ion channel family protein [Parvularcula marina]|uniref:mechanosensitive ion channel family protein n=1 Tax=Parvularcula marina TaxID=2292771 RepID=UPI003518D005